MNLPELEWHHLPSGDTRKRFCQAMVNGPSPVRRVLTFSPVYPSGDPMRFRVLDPQFLGLATEVTHFVALDYQIAMTDHPLTNDLCDKIQDSAHPCDPENMRSAADWQLDQVTNWLRNNLRFGGYLTPVKYTDEDEIDVDEVVEDLQKAMRPQEDNND